MSPGGPSLTRRGQEVEVIEERDTSHINLIISIKAKDEDKRVNLEEIAPREVSPNLDLAIILV